MAWYGIYQHEGNHSQIVALGPLVINRTIPEQAAAPDSHTLNDVEYGSISKAGPPQDSRRASSNRSTGIDTATGTLIQTPDGTIQSKVRSP